MKDGPVLPSQCTGFFRGAWIKGDQVVHVVLGESNRHMPVWTQDAGQSASNKNVRRSMQL